MASTVPLYEQVQNQLNRYSNTRFSRQAVSDMLATVAQNLMDDHPEAARSLMVEADVAQQMDDLFT